MHLRTGGGEGLSARIAASQAEYLVAGLDQITNNGRADKAGGPGDKNTHRKTPDPGFFDGSHQLALTNPAT
jgi:hypothetical protein